MKVFWSEFALKQRNEIFDYIGNDNPLAAIRMDELFEQAAARLADHPFLGKEGKVAGTRELIPHESFRLIYEIKDGVIWVITLIHSARQWPRL